MKKCLLLFYWACTVCMLYAQDKNTSSFLFDDFQEAVVYFKNGSQFREKMNYNILANKFYFVDRVDNKVKALSNPQDIQVIKFGNRVFYTEWYRDFADESCTVCTIQREYAQRGLKRCVRPTYRNNFCKNIRRNICRTRRTL